MFVVAAVLGTFSLAILLAWVNEAGKRFEWEQHRSRCLCEKCKNWRAEMRKAGVEPKEPQC